MTRTDSAHVLVGTYVLGLFDAEEERAALAHLSRCTQCREEADQLRTLGSVLDPDHRETAAVPAADDLLLRRILDQVRNEKAHAGRRRGALMAAGVVGLLAISISGGVLLGSSAVRTPTVAGPSATKPAPVPGTEHITGTDKATGVSMKVTVTPADGWLSVEVHPQGLAPGQRCVLFAVSKQGQRVQFGGWVVPVAPPKKSVGMYGSVMLTMDELASVTVLDDSGRTLVSVPVPA